MGKCLALCPPLARFHGNNKKTNKLAKGSFSPIQLSVQEIQLQFVSTNLVAGILHSVVCQRIIAPFQALTPIKPLLMLHIQEATGANSIRQIQPLECAALEAGAGRRMERLW